MAVNVLVQQVECVSEGSLAMEDGSFVGWCWGDRKLSSRWVCSCIYMRVRACAEERERVCVLQWSGIASVCIVVIIVIFFGRVWLVDRESGCVGVSAANILGEFALCWAHTGIRYPTLRDANVWVSLKVGIELLEIGVACSDYFFFFFFPFNRFRLEAKRLPRMAKLDFYYIYLKIDKYAD